MTNKFKCNTVTIYRNYTRRKSSIRHTKCGVASLKIPYPSFFFPPKGVQSLLYPPHIEWRCSPTYSCINPFKGKKGKAKALFTVYYPPFTNFSYRTEFPSQGSGKKGKGPFLPFLPKRSEGDPLGGPFGNLLSVSKNEVRYKGVAKSSKLTECLNRTEFPSQGSGKKGKGPPFGGVIRAEGGVRTEFPSLPPLVTPLRPLVPLFTLYPLPPAGELRAKGGVTERSSATAAVITNFVSKLAQGVGGLLNSKVKVRVKRDERAVPKGTGQRGVTVFNRYFLSDFVDIQRKSFFTLLEKGLIEEFSKRNPITNTKKTMELFFYPEYYQLTPPEYTPSQAIVKSKSYTSRLYIPVQLTDKTSNIIKLKWVYIGNIPLMTKRGHFILNGCARVIVNQMIRSPGLYFQKKIYENYVDQWSEKPETTYERYYADLICNRGTWLRIEIDKYNRIWAQMKRVPKIPIMWFLIAMGLPEKIILKKGIDSQMLLYNFFEDPTKQNPPTPQPYVKTPPAAWAAIYNLVTRKKKENKEKDKSEKDGADTKGGKGKKGKGPRRGLLPNSVRLSPPEGGGLASGGEVSKAKGGLTYGLPLPPKGVSTSKKEYKGVRVNIREGKGIDKNSIRPPVAYALTNIAGRGSSNKMEAPFSPLGELGRKWIFNKFMNPRTYDLGMVGRLNFNRKLNLSISINQTTLTPQDLLLATDYLILVSKGLRQLDDIDHLKNRRVRTSGELIQLQIGIGLVRLEKNIREKMNKIHAQMLSYTYQSTKGVIGKNSYLSSRSVALAENAFLPGGELRSNPPKGVTPLRGVIKRVIGESAGLTPNLSLTFPFLRKNKNKLAVFTGKKAFPKGGGKGKGPSFGLPPQRGGLERGSVKRVIKRDSPLRGQFTFSNIMNTKPFNGALKEFFGSSPLSQFMDQINPLAELTHKRRLSSMGPGGVTRDSATLEIRSIHPSHYGRICPVETPEGKNTGLVNSLTAYARVNSNGYIETPFYRVYKGQVQKKTGFYFFSAKQEEKIQLGASDLYTSDIGFLPLASIPVRIFEDFTKISRNSIQYVGVAPIQMISIATSLIPFFEHDDGNRALMGSNMQRQAVPILKPQRPIVGTGLESRAVSDSGHVIQTKFSGVVTYVSSNNIQIYSF